jgi:glycerate 2-kinase
MHLRAIIDAAVAGCDARRLLTRALAVHALPVNRPFNIVAAGKAARPMAAAFTDAHSARVREIVVATGSHPLPNHASVDSGARALRLAAASRARDECLIVLLSGGASAMLAAPADGISLEDKIDVTRLLLRSGLPISEMNAVRKHLSGIKGGQLGAAAGRSITFAISDVHAPVEDDPAVIGSGPTVGDPTTFADAIRALQNGRLWDALPRVVASRLERGARGDHPETIPPGDSRLAASEFVLAGSRRDAMAGAADVARSRGFHVVTLNRPVLGEARVAAASFVQNARGQLGPARPVCVVASGETTVTVTGNGVGGRNQEFALAATPLLEPVGVCALASVGTDGIDGPTDAAGAIADATTASRAQQSGLDLEAALRNHDSYPFFRALGDLIVTGPTQTNVGDLQILLVE